MRNPDEHDAVQAMETVGELQNRLRIAKESRDAAVWKWRGTLMRGDRVWGPRGLFVIGEIIAGAEAEQRYGLKTKPKEGALRCFVPEGKTQEDAAWDVYPVTPELEKKQQLLDRLAAFELGDFRTRLYECSDVNASLAVLDVVEQALVQWGIPPRNRDH